MRRKLLGILSALLLLAAAYGLLIHGVGDDQASMVTSMCLRIGLVLGATWLAFPQLERLSGNVSPWAVMLVGAAVVAIVIRPRTILVFGPVLLLLGLLHMAGRILRTPPKRKR